MNKSPKINFFEFVEGPLVELRDISRLGLADRSPDYQEETLETAGCTGGCPIYPGAPVTEDGYPDCSKCPQFQNEKEKI